MSISAAVAIASGLAKFVPDVVGWIAGDKAEEAAQEIVNIAEGITGQTGDKALDAINSDPAAALEFKKAVLAQKHRLDEIYLKDRQNARESYKIHHQASDAIAFMIMKFNLPLVLLLVIIEVLAIIYVDNKAVLGSISTTVGFVINALLKERQDVTAFFYGSSMGSKMKTILGSKS